jgi:ArsR family transcriptional regulator, arsenate/arsenite/antimonite-responsive transcriptional repressor / arsenate reductase (thioredoxin)
MDARLERVAAVHAALGEPVRLGIVEELVVSDRAPSELGRRFGVAGNLLAHHVDVLERVGLVERVVSSGDRRRRYVRLRRDGLGDLVLAPPGRRGRALFLCSGNSARSQLAAAVWQRDTGSEAASAGTHPAAEVHPGAVAAARRAGLDLSGCRPRALTRDDLGAAVVVTVCDRAREELEPGEGWLHWSIADPVEAGSRRAFDEALAELEARISVVTSGPREARPS